MADYFPLISRAVAALDPNTRERREAIYARARDALNRQLLSLEPPIAAADLQRERNVLDDTIRRVEAECAPERTAADPTQPVRLPPLPSLRPAAGIQPHDDAPRPVPRDPAPPEARRPATTRPAQENSEPPAPPRRPKVDKRPTGLFASGDRSRLILFVGLPALVAVGAVAWVLRDDPARYQPNGGDATPSETQQQSQQRKSAGRLDGTGSATPAAGVTPSREIQSQQAMLPVAARTLFFEEKADDPKGAQSDGQVVWQVERPAGRAGQPALPVIRGAVSVAKANMGIELTVRKNTDATLPASHVVDVIFRPEGGRSSVRTIGPIEARDQETTPGVPLKGAMVPVGDNMFLIGLDKTELAIASNLEALGDKKWFAFQFQLADGKLGAVLIEKGPTGERVFREVLEAWSKR